MTRNRLLNIAIIICKLFKGFFIFSFIILTILFIHFQIDREYYTSKIDNSKISFNSGFKKNIFNISTSTRWKEVNAGNDEKVYTLKNIKITSLYIIYFKCVGVLLCLFLSIKEFQKVMLSVKNLQTFKRENVLSFKRIGKYLFGFFLLTSYTAISFEKGAFSSTHINLTPLLFVLVAFIMAEIFKEGNALEEENDLTI